MAARMTSTLTEPAAYIACRTLGHAWDPTWNTVDLGRPAAGCVWLRLRCTRCATERLDTVARSTGEVADRRYQYPDAYKRSRDDQLPRADWRAAYLRVAGIIPNGARHMRSVS